MLILNIKILVGCKKKSDHPEYTKEEFRDFIDKLAEKWYNEKERYKDRKTGKWMKHKKNEHHIVTYEEIVEYCEIGRTKLIVFNPFEEYVPNYSDYEIIEDKTYFTIKRTDGAEVIAEYFDVGLNEVKAKIKEERYQWMAN